jgi:hypothetical protein
VAKKNPRKSGRMATNMNQVTTQSLHNQSDQVAMQPNKKENVIKEELQF